MAIVFIDSFVYQGKFGNAAVAKGERLPTDKWEITVASPIAPFILGPDDPDTSLDFARYALELGDNRIHHVGKTIAPTDNVVFGANWNWQDETQEETFIMAQDIEFRNADGVVATLFIHGSDLKLYVGSVDTGTLVSTTAHGLGSKITQNSKIEVRCKQHPTLGELEVAINGTVKVLTTGLALGSVKITEIRIGARYQNPTLMQMNDVYINDVTSGFSSPSDFFGTGLSWVVTAKSPIAANAANEFDNTNLALDPQKGDSDVTFTHAGALGKKLKLDYYPMGTAKGTPPAFGVDDVLVEDVIFAVQVSNHQRKSGTEPLSFKTQIDIGGTVSQSIEVQANAVSAFWKGHVITEHPSTQAVLVRADVDSIIGGVEITKRGL